MHSPVPDQCALAKSNSRSAVTSPCIFPSPTYSFWLNRALAEDEPQCLKEARLRALRIDRQPDRNQTAVSAAGGMLKACAVAHGIRLTSERERQDPIGLRTGTRDPQSLRGGTRDPIGLRTGTGVGRGAERLWLSRSAQVQAESDRRMFETCANAQVEFGGPRLNRALEGIPRRQRRGTNHPLGTPTYPGPTSEAYPIPRPPIPPHRTPPTPTPPHPHTPTPLHPCTPVPLYPHTPDAQPA